MFNLTRLILYKPLWTTTKPNIRPFSTSPKPQAIPPLVWLVVKPLTKLSSIIFGRSFRKWWTALPVQKKQIFSSHLTRNKHRYGLIIATTGIGSFAFYQAHLQQNPITGRKRFILFSRDQIHEVSKLGYDFMLENNRDKLVNPGAKSAQRVVHVTNRLIAANKTLPGLCDIKWTVRVIESDLVNAVAFPDGSIIVYTGLIKHCRTDDELAIILGHEMSHAILEHSVEAMSLARLVDILSIGLIFLVWSLVPSDVAAVLGQVAANEFLKIYFDLPYSRMLETEADKVGLMIAARACFDVRKSVTFWSGLGEKTDLAELDEYLSTHPSHENRSKELLKLMPDALKLRDHCNCHQLEKFSEAVHVLKKK